MSSFSDLGLIPALERAVHDAGYREPTPIQAQAVPHLLAGRDLLGCARTGTGKTAAFALPILQHLSRAGRRAAPRSVRSLVLVPTRELAVQVAESFETYGRGLALSVAVIHGGVGQQPQVRWLQRGLDVLVATPGRLIDLMQQRYARLDQVEILVLDEADHMLDLGFIPDVRRILAALPRKRQTLLFSATMPGPIAELASGILHEPAKVFVTPAATTVDAVEQGVHFVDDGAKAGLLARLLANREVERALVFTRTKRGADRVANRLVSAGIRAEAIHGNKSQNARQRTLEAFRSGRVRVLVATDLAARGIDVDGITHVINYELPDVPETYVHRIGRTARAGASGIAISLCGGDEREQLRSIERLIRKSVPVLGAPRRHEAPARQVQARRAG
jgi:ATP-dependent RNA helicase RhlE